jgi:hypothetical protein
LETVPARQIFLIDRDAQSTWLRRGTHCGRLRQRADCVPGGRHLEYIEQLAPMGRRFPEIDWRS